MLRRPGTGSAGSTPSPARIARLSSTDGTRRSWPRKSRCSIARWLSASSSASSSVSAQTTETATATCGSSRWDDGRKCARYQRAGAPSVGWMKSANA